MAADARARHRSPRVHPSLRRPDQRGGRSVDSLPLRTAR